MEIFFIGEKSKIGVFPNLIKDLGNVVHLNEGKDINSYVELLQSDEDKVIVVEPGLIEWSMPNEFLSEVPNLKAIVSRSSWALFLDLDFCKANDIKIINSPNANSIAVAEYAVWQLQSLVKKLPLQLKSNFDNPTNESNITEEISGKVVGILGLGSIGNHIADICEGLGCEVQFWNRSKKESRYKQTDLDTILSTSKFLFKCYETCDETKEILNVDSLKLIPETSYFVSVFGGLGYGGDDDQVLLDRVEKGKLAGFSIENEHEPNFDVKETYAGNVFIPAALAWYTKETQVRYDKVVAEGVRGIIEGKAINVIV
jgi:phosphoglycerate dehydrogenase-like enzyme